MHTLLIKGFIESYKNLNMPIVKIDVVSFPIWDSLTFDQKKKLKKIFSDKG